MISPADFRNLVSGRRTGLFATVLRGLLRTAETPYRLAVDWRNGRYDRDAALVHKVGVPVVCVGNLTLGGTGKTPLVKWIARWFAERGVRVAIVSRGYKAASGAPNDEARELMLSLPDVPHVQNSDRVAAARAAIGQYGCNLILLDDGFQRRRLGRDLDIVLLDALEPFGFEHVFPRGTLREPLGGLRRAKIVCLSRAEVVTPSERDAIRRRVDLIAPQAAWCEVMHAPSGLIDATGRVQPFDSLRGRRVAAFCGIGNPAGFRHTLSSAACQLVAWREFPDHYDYGRADIDALSKLAADAQAELVVCTQKDLVKLGGEKIAEQIVQAVAIEIEFIAGREVFEEALRTITAQLAAGPISPRAMTGG